MQHEPAIKPAAAKPATGSFEEEESDQYDPDEDDELENEEPEPEPIRNKAKQRLSREAAAHRIRAERAEDKVAVLEQQITELEGASANETLVAENQELRVTNAFLKESDGMFADTDAALKLLDRELITVASDGQVQGMGEAILTLKSRYAFLLADGKPGSAKTQPDGAGPERRTVQRAEEGQRGP
jgi:hypothetical protein